MGLFEKLFRPKAVEAAQIATYYKALNAYSPAFTSRTGALYEMELTRSAIHAVATAFSKLKPEVAGAARPGLGAMLEFAPNPWMDTSKFLYRLATVVQADTTAFIIPLEDPATGATVGLFPLLPSRTDIVDYDGMPWLRFMLPSGQKAAVEWGRVGVMTTHQYKDDFFGSGHSALDPTLDLLDVQRQGMSEGIKSSAAIRFMAKLGLSLKPADISAERDRFAKENLSVENTSGVMMFDTKYADVKQIDSKQFVVDAAQMELIQNNVYSYFGVNEDILQNSYDENTWNAFYEGKIEPLALQAGLVLTNMLYTERERAFGNKVILTSNRLQYASNTTKLAVTRDLTDRGLMSDRQACDMWNLPYPKDADGHPLPERWVIRGEYIDTQNLPTHTLGDARSYLTPGDASGMMGPDPEGEE